MIEQSLSDKIKIGGLLCTVLVVLRHSFNLQAFGLANSNGVATFMEQGISKQTEVAVPFFFMVSGFFFFRYTYYGRGEYFRMTGKKMRTLFVPFLFWNIFGVIVLLLTRRLVVEDEMWRYGLQLLHSDWNGVLWYVRDIMTFMLLVPLYGWIFAVNNKWLYLVVFIGLFTQWIPVDCAWLSSEGMLFFFLGGVLQRYPEILKVKMPVWSLSTLTAVWLVSCFMYPHWWSIHRYNTLLGIIILWQWLDNISNRWREWLLKISPLAFFIYVMHAYILKTMKVILGKVFPSEEIVALLAFFLLPIVTIMILYVIGDYWNRKHPKSFLFVTGGRG